MERIVPIETGVVATIGNVDVDWFEDDDSHTFKFNLPGISLYLCVYIIHMQTLKHTWVFPHFIKSLDSSLYYPKFLVKAHEKDNMQYN